MESLRVGIFLVFMKGDKMKDRAEIVIWLAKIFVIVFLSISLGMELLVGLYIGNCWYDVCSVRLGVLIVCLVALLTDFIYRQLEEWR